MFDSHFTRDYEIARRGEIGEEARNHFPWSYDPSGGNGVWAVLGTFWQGKQTLARKGQLYVFFQNNHFSTILMVIEPKQGSV